MKDQQLDRTLDDVLAAMTTPREDASLRARVVARLSEGEPRRRSRAAVWVVAGAAMAGALALVLVRPLVDQPVRPAPGTQTAQSTPPAAGIPAPEPVPPTVDAAVAKVDTPTNTAPVRTAARRATRPLPPQADPPFPLVTVPPLIVDRVHVQPLDTTEEFQTLAPPDPVDVAPIDIEPISPRR